MNDKLIIKKYKKYVSRLIEMIDSNQELSDETFEERVELESELLILESQQLEIPEELFRKVVIKSKKDLPTKSGEYFAFIRDDQEIQQWTYSKSSDNDDSDVDWFSQVDWYFQPLSHTPETKVTEQAERKEFVKTVLDAWDKAEANIKDSRSELITFFAWQNCLSLEETERVVDNYLNDRLEVRKKQ